MSGFLIGDQKSGLKRLKTKRYEGLNFDIKDESNDVTYSKR